jgi:DNA mismatch repair ATPase MutS
VREHLRDLRFPDGVLISARLGPAGTGIDHVLRPPRRPSGRPLRRLTGGREGIDVRVQDGDDTAARAIDDIIDRGVARTAALLARSNAEILAFLVALRHQLSFYLGCVNLRRRLGDRRVCRPTPVPGGRRQLSCRGLYDACLPLTAQDRPAVGNDLDADHATLIMVTGANQGGKSTFLRALGLAHLMMQCGMFVPAASMRATVRPGVFTHFPRNEEATMTRGRLDEELARLSSIADRLTGGALVLLNESFATTYEREGSHIAGEIIRALTERDITVVFVTHLFDLAHGLYTQGGDDAVFLRADRLPDGRRTFRLRPGAPQPTGYGPDLYRRIFGSTSADQ